MFFKDRKKPAGGASRVAFLAAKDGGLTVDRDALHRSDRYKRQIEALVEISKRLKPQGQ